MSSGILTGFAVAAPAPPVTSCTDTAPCAEWSGAVVEKGGRTVLLATDWSNRACASLDAVSEDDYFAWSDARDKYGCPLSVVIIKRAAISAKDVVSVTPGARSS